MEAERKKMRIATLTNPEEIVITETEKPVAKDNEVVIKVDYIGICGSDIHAYYGKHPFINCPITLGHEFTGKVVETGQKVRNVLPGEMVTAMPQIFCGECEPCESGRYNICNTLKVIGCQTPGAACDYFAFDSSLVKKIPEGMPNDIAATIEPAAVGVHAVHRGTDVQGKNVVVMGAGTIGNLTAQAALANGARQVLITDLSDYRLRKAVECGILKTANTGKISMEKAIDEAFQGELADIFFECVGIGTTVNQAIELSKKGHDIVIVGVYGMRPEVNMSLVQDKELRLIGSLMYVEKDYDETIDLMSRGIINTKPLISKTFELADYAKAFRYIEEHKDGSLKILIQVSGD